jgi:hypothetical protein
MIDDKSPVDLDDEPQLASLIILQRTLAITSAALYAHHGELGTRGMPYSHRLADSLVMLLARQIEHHCDPLIDLIDAYDAALTAAETDPDKPF